MASAGQADASDTFPLSAMLRPDPRRELADRLRVIGPGHGWAYGESGLTWSAYRHRSGPRLAGPGVIGRASPRSGLPSDPAPYSNARRSSMGFDWLKDRWSSMRIPPGTGLNWFAGWLAGCGEPSRERGVPQQPALCSV